MYRYMKNFRRVGTGIWVCEAPAELHLPQGRVQAPQGHVFIIGSKFMNVDVARLLDEEYSRHAQPRS